MLFTILVGLLVIAILAMYLYMAQYRGVVESFGIPMVKPFLIFGSPPFLFNKYLIHEYWQNMFKKFGKTWGRYDGIRPTIVTIDPDILKEVLVKQFDNFTDTFDFHTKPEETSLDISRGDEWRALRKILSPVFTSGKLKGMLEPMEDIADDAIDYIGEQVKKNPEFDIKPIIQGFTLDTISRVGFGLQTKAHRGENSDFAKAAYEIFSSFRADNMGMVFFFNLINHFPFFLHNMNVWPDSAHKMRKMTHDLMDERAKKNITLGDFIDKLKDEVPKLEAPITREMLDAQGMIFLTAGFETTANTLGHLMYNMAMNPDKQDIAYDEIASIFDQEDSVINHETIKDLHYLEATIMESMRLCPPVTEHDRLCTRDCVVNGIKIPVGTKIQMPTYAAHYNEEFWPEPKKFEPERFLKENADKIIPYTWRPFGGGNRVCIGQRFAMIEIKIFLAKLLSKFRIVATPKTVLEYVKGDLFLLHYNEMVVKLEAR